MSGSIVRDRSPLEHYRSADGMSLEDVTYLGTPYPHKITSKQLVTGYTSKGKRYQYLACRVE